jgi:MOSC domain-containing protein
MRVRAIWRYPVKAMLGELLDAVAIGPRGCEGDRRWIVVDALTGARIANKRGPTDPRLRACRAELLDASEERPPLRMTLPDASTVEGAEIEAALCELLERRVRLERSDAPADGRFATTGAFHDLAPIHLITTGTLAHLRAVAPESDWDVRRFRPNLVLDDGPDGEPFAEDALLGGRLEAPSGLELTVGLPTPRCVVPTRAQDGLPADPALLRTLVARHRIDLSPFGRQGCAGAYAEIARAGRLSRGEHLDVRHGDLAPRAAIDSALSRLPEHA